MVNFQRKFQEKMILKKSHNVLRLTDPIASRLRRVVEEE